MFFFVFFVVNRPIYTASDEPKPHANLTFLLGIPHLLVRRGLTLDGPTRSQKDVGWPSRQAAMQAEQRVCLFFGGRIALFFVLGSQGGPRKAIHPFQLLAFERTALNAVLGGSKGEVKLKCARESQIKGFFGPWHLGKSVLLLQGCNFVNCSCFEGGGC